MYTGIQNALVMNVIISMVCKKSKSKFKKNYFYFHTKKNGVKNIILTLKSLLYSAQNRKLNVFRFKVAAPGHFRQPLKKLSAYMKFPCGRMKRQQDEEVTKMKR